MQCDRAKQVCIQEIGPLVGVVVGGTGPVLLGHIKARGIMLPSTSYRATAQEYLMKLFKLPRTRRGATSSIVTPQTR